MVTIYVGTDGSFLTGWQFWKIRNHQPHRFVLSYKDIIVLRSGEEEFIWYEGFDEDELPAEIYVDGVTVTDDRSGEDSNIDASPEE